MSMATHIRPARKGDEAALSRVKYLANKNNPDKLFNTPGYNDPKNEDWLITRGVACFTMKVAKGTVVLAETADGEIVGLAEWILPQEMEEEEEEAADDLQAKVQSTPANLFNEHRRQMKRAVIDSLPTKYFKGHLVRNGIAVLPDYQGRGIGKQLTDYISQTSREQGLSIGVLASPAAARVNLRCGYETVEEVKLEDKRPGQEAMIVLYVQRWQY